ncbi:MAG: L,D-transpeptidase [Myxococcales bacterium]|nr:L,D-transpeptidase [Myxococcales bacterium]
MASPRTTLARGPNRQLGLGTSFAMARCFSWRAARAGALLEAGDVPPADCRKLVRGPQMRILEAPETAMPPSDSGKPAGTTQPEKNRRVSRSGEETAASPKTSSRAPGRTSPKAGPNSSPDALRATPTPRGRGAALAGAILGVVIGGSAIGALSWSSGCGQKTAANDRVPSAIPSAISSTRSSAASAVVPIEEPPPPDDSKEPEAAEPESPKPLAEKAWGGPWLAALAQVTPIYPTARLSKNRLGYLRRGGKVPAQDKPIRTTACPQGFYPLVDGGYVCSKYAALELNDAPALSGIRAPDLEGALPYRYAYNTEHGTPLYGTPPSREAMLEYEPYLKDREKKKPRATKSGDAAVDAEGADRPRPTGTDAKRSDLPSTPSEPGQKPAHRGEPSALTATRDGAIAPASSAALSPNPESTAPSGSAAPLLLPPRTSPSAEPSDPRLTGTGGLGGGGSDSSAEADDELDKPWWQRSKKSPLDIKLADLDERGGALKKRMVKGFFIAVDSTVSLNDRLFYKTTDGLLAPSDRMVIPKTPGLKGFEWSEGHTRVGFIRIPKAQKYVLDEKGKSFRKSGAVERFTASALTGETRLVDRQRFYETTSGWWMREGDSNLTDPAPRPEQVGPDEKWIDVNLTKKTLVAFVGDKPVYAALIAPGKSSPNKARDHRTKTGIFRIREKHIAATMDGDGGTSGDLPYSIMDVPYVQYYDGSYALHAAFWHSNFGREQSHGCVNLAPLDAKWLFFWTEPNIPRGWHGVWGSEKRRGTVIAIHE